MIQVSMRFDAFVSLGNLANQTGCPTAQIGWFSLGRQLSYWVCRIRSEVGAIAIDREIPTDSGMTRKRHLSDILAI